MMYHPRNEIPTCEKSQVEDKMQLPLPYRMETEMTMTTVVYAFHELLRQAMVAVAVNGKGGKEVVVVGAPHRPHLYIFHDG